MYYHRGNRRATRHSTRATGSGFVASSLVQWNGTNLATTYVSGTVLTATVRSSDLSAVGPVPVTVVNTGPGGGVSRAQTFTIARPDGFPGGLVNGADYSNRLAAGSFAALFGSGLASSTFPATSLPLPKTLASVSVLVNGFAAPLYYLSPNQINLQLPWELEGATELQVVVRSIGISAPPLQLSLSPVAPALLSADGTGTGQGAILVAGTSQLAGPSRPVKRTEAVAIYCTGLGPVTAAPASGSAAPLDSLAHTLDAPSVKFGGVAGTVLYSGLAPGLVGVYQVNVQLPPDAPTGTAVPVVLTMPGGASNTVTVSIE